MSIEFPAESMELIATNDQTFLATMRDRLDMAARSAEGLIIGNDKAAEDATGSLALVRKTRKQLDARRLELTRPIDEKKRLVAMPFNLLADDLKRVDSILAPKITHWHDQVEAKRRAAAEEDRQRQLAELEEQKAAQLEQAKTNESAYALEDAIDTEAKIKEVQEAVVPESVSRVTTRTFLGSASRTKQIQIVIENIKKVPRKYLVQKINETVIRAAFRGGERNFPGLRVEEVSTLSVR